MVQQRRKTPLEKQTMPTKVMIEIYTEQPNIIFRELLKG